MVKVSLCIRFLLALLLAGSLFATPALADDKRDDAPPSSLAVEEEAQTSATQHPPEQSLPTGQDESGFPTGQDESGSSQFEEYDRAEASSPPAAVSESNERSRVQDGASLAIQPAYLPNTLSTLGSSAPATSVEVPTNTTFLLKPKSSPSKVIDIYGGTTTKNGTSA
ncbi:MAG: hypothetical protein LBU07_04105, partial [Coriobacteriales bacterium]|nr:hypothetical protein [Coriobacteriales bacterium]